MVTKCRLPSFVSAPLHLDQAPPCTLMIMLTTQGGSNYLTHLCPYKAKSTKISHWPKPVVLLNSRKSKASHHITHAPTAIPIPPLPPPSHHSDSHPPTPSPNLPTLPYPPSTPTPDLVILPLYVMQEDAPWIREIIFF